MKADQSQSPDDRFLTTHGFEQALELREIREILEMEQGDERRRQLLYKALAGIRKEGEGCTSSHQLSEIVRLASETLAEHEKDLRRSDQPLDEKVLSLGLRAIEHSKEWLNHPRANFGVEPWERQKAAAALRGGVELLKKWHQHGMNVGENVVKDIAAAVGKSVHDSASSYAEIGAKVSGMAELAIEEADAIRSRTVSLTEPGSERGFDWRDTLNDRKALGDLIVAKSVWDSVVKMTVTGSPYEENEFLVKYAMEHSNIGIGRPAESDFVAKHPEFIPIIVGQAYNSHRAQAEEVVMKYIKGGENIPMPIAEDNTIEKAKALAYDLGLYDHFRNLQLIDHQPAVERGHETPGGNGRER